MISSNLHLKSNPRWQKPYGTYIQGAILRFQLLFPDFYHCHHVISGMKWAKKVKTKNGQNMSSGPFSHDAAHVMLIHEIHVFELQIEAIFEVYDPRSFSAT